MTIPVINTQQGPISVDLDDMVRSTGFRVVPMLPQEAIADLGDVAPNLKLRANRERLPERKRGQIVAREVVMLIRA
jgi:hypothetical protein